VSPAAEKYAKLYKDTRDHGELWLTVRDPEEFGKVLHADTAVVLLEGMAKHASREANMRAMVLVKAVCRLSNENKRIKHAGGLFSVASKGDHDDNKLASISATQLPPGGRKDEEAAVWGQESPWVV
jgi:hypothetical protein